METVKLDIGLCSTWTVAEELLKRLNSMEGRYVPINVINALLVALEIEVTERMAPIEE
jgi:hypothetical protein